MKIAVLGAGNIGSTLGRKWAQVGHNVMFGVRDVSRPKVQALLQTVEGNASAEAIAAAIAFGEVILFALPADAVEETVGAHAGVLQGKIIIDATNKFGSAVINSLGVFADKVPTAKVVRAFNSLGWENFAEPQFGATQADLFYCGPDDETRPTIEGLIADVGLRPIRVGGLDQVQLVDNIGALWVQLALRQGMGRRLAFKVLTP